MRSRSPTVAATPAKSAMPASQNASAGQIGAFGPDRAARDGGGTVGLTGLGVGRRGERGPRQEDRVGLADRSQIRDLLGEPSLFVAHDEPLQEVRAVGELLELVAAECGAARELLAGGEVAVQGRLGRAQGHRPVDVARASERVRRLLVFVQARRELGRLQVREEIDQERAVGAQADRARSRGARGELVGAAREREPFVARFGPVRVPKVYRHLRRGERLGIVELFRNRERLVGDASLAFVIGVVQVRGDSRQDRDEALAVARIDAGKRFFEQAERMRLQDRSVGPRAVGFERDIGEEGRVVALPCARRGGQDRVTSAFELLVVRPRPSDREVQPS